MNSFNPKSRRTIFGDRQEDDFNQSMTSFNDKRRTAAQTPNIGLSSI
jgi:hypothetical protein